MSMPKKRLPFLNLPECPSLESMTHVLDISKASSPEKSALLAKLPELEMQRAEVMARMYGDIAAVKRVLSFM